MSESFNSTFHSHIAEELKKDKEANLERKLTLLPKNVVEFCDNDYLGLANDPILIEAAQKAAADYGIGTGAARLMSGNSKPHVQLEEKLAAWKKREAALLFPTGYGTAIGTIPALVGPDDCVIVDKKIHACLLDGAKLSGALLKVFPHNDLNYLDSLLSEIRRKQTSGNILIVVESIYSMDGDFSPLDQIVELKDKYGAWLLVDEAHATGLYGKRKSGRCEELEVTDRVEIQMGTLGKAVGASGGFVAGSQELINLLIHRARSFIFTTGSSPIIAAAASASIDLIRGKGGDERLAALHKNVKLVRSHLAQREDPNPSAIIPLLIGDEKKALQVAQKILDQGFFVPAIRFPTVSKGAARLRLSIHANHTEKQIEKFLKVMDEVVFKA